MNNYKVNVKYGTENINDILIKVLNIELKKYLRMICKNDQKDVSSSCTYLSTKDEEDKK